MTWLIFLVKIMRTYNGKPVITTVLALDVQQNPSHVTLVGYTEANRDSMMFLLGFKEKLLHKSMVIANAAGKIKREEGWSVTTVKSCSRKNVYVYVETAETYLVVLETPFTVLTPKDRERLSKRADFGLLETIESIRLDVSKLPTSNPKPVETSTAVEPTEPKKLSNEDPVIGLDPGETDRPVLAEPYRPVGLFERIVRWISGKF